MADQTETDRHYAAIGKVVVEWAQFEATIDNRALQLAGFDTYRGLCFTLQIIGPGRKLSAYIATAQLLDVKASIITKLHKFQQRVTSVAEKRNRVIHDQWVIEPSGVALRLELTANKTLIAEFKDHDAGKIEHLRSEIESYISEFEALHDEAMAAADAMLR